MLTAALARRLRPYRGYVYVLPLLAVLGAVVVYPVIYNTGVAFYHYDFLRDRWSFAGLQKFAELFSSPLFWQSFWVTLVWVAGNVALQFVIGLAVALALNRLEIGRKVLGGVFLVPWISSYVIVAIMWLWTYHPQLGVLNDILLRLGLIEQPVAWLASPGHAQLALIITNSWKFFPILMTTLLAGLQGIPRDLVEAAEVDGASRWQLLRGVILPCLAPSVLISIMIATIWAFNAFTLPFIMTGGGPLRSTEILGLYIYRQAFVSYNFGVAAAGSLFLFLQILLVVVFYVRTLGRDQG